MTSGLTLGHGSEHLYQAVIEGVAYGTEEIFATMRSAGYTPQEFVLCGGATRSELWMQIHVDVSGIPLQLTKVPDAAALGSAILAAVGIGAYASIAEACAQMVEFTRVIEPDMEKHQAYHPLLEACRATYRDLKDTLHTLPRHWVGRWLPGQPCLRLKAPPPKPNTNWTKARRWCGFSFRPSLPPNRASTNRATPPCPAS